MAAPTCGPEKSLTVTYVLFVVDYFAGVASYGSHKH